MDRLKRIAGRVFAVLLGVVWGFFVSFNAVFSDVFGARDMAGALVYVLVGFALLGLGFGLAAPSTGPRWAWWLATPGVLMVALFTIGEYQRLLYHALVVAAVVGGAAGGAALGAFVRGAVRGRGAVGPGRPA
ncbi:MAG: hypothetical protein IBX62_01105 [Coriobacteriia bacterium]|nr:hypothetical protein [Coriobacteriia bacterium]